MDPTTPIKIGPAPKPVCPDAPQKISRPSIDPNNLTPIQLIEQESKYDDNIIPSFDE